MYEKIEKGKHIKKNNGDIQPPPKPTNTSNAANLSNNNKTEKKKKNKVVPIQQLNV